MFAANRFKSGVLRPDRLPGLAAWYSADYGVLSQVGGGTAFASASSQYLSVADNSSLAITSELSVSAWVKCAFPGTQHVIAQYDTNAQRGWKMTALAAGAAPFAIAISADGGSTNLKNYAIAPTANVWNHIAFTFTANTLKVYLNGSEVASPAKLSDGTVNSLHNSTAPLTIGCIPASGTPSEFFTGSVDEATVHSRVLSASEITWLYNSGAGRTYSEADASMKTNLVSWWSMNAPASGDWQDQHGTNHLTPSVSRPTATEGVTFNAATDGQTVRRWLDRSGNARHLEQVTLLSQPTFSGGRVVFSAHSMSYASGGPFTFAGAGSIFCILKTTTSAALGYGAVIAQYTASGTSLFWCAADYPNAGVRYTLDAWGNRSHSKEAGTLNAETYEGFSWDNWQTASGIVGATGKVANTITSTGSGSPTSLPAGAWKIGATDLAAAGFFIGSIAEIVCCTTAINPAILAAYATRKWGTA